MRLTVAIGLMAVHLLSLVTKPLLIHTDVLLQSSKSLFTISLPTLLHMMSSFHQTDKTNSICQTIILQYSLAFRSKEGMGSGIIVL